MSLRFILGRAGSGKSRHCLLAVREALRVDPLSGPRLVLLVPEQAALQTERALLDGVEGLGQSAKDVCAPRLGAFHRAEVLSFRRLAFRVMGDARGRDREAISEAARSMVLRRLLTDHAPRLAYYGRCVQSGRRGGRLCGVVRSIASCVAELLSESISPDELSRMTDATDVSAPDGGREDGLDPAQRAKFHDLSILYRSYLEFLGSKLLDPSQYLEPVREALPRCEWLDGARVWVDGFASFGGQEVLTLITLARRCERVEVSLLLDPSTLGDVKGNLPAEADAQAGKLAALRLFSRTLATHSELERRSKEAGIVIEPPVKLGARPPARFSTSTSLAMLEGGFMGSAWRDADTEAAGGAETSDIEIAELPTRRLEVEYAVARIRDWARRDGFRYRDVTIIVRDMSPYHDLLRHALESRNIPCFIDQRRSVNHHPLVGLLRGLIQCASESLSVSSVRNLLKTGFLRIDTRSADQLENFILAHDVSGRGAWEREWTPTSRAGLLGGRRALEGESPAGPRFDSLNQARRTFVRSLATWLDSCAESPTRSGADWIGLLFDLFSTLGVSGTLARWARESTAAGNLDEAEEHRRVWSDVTTLLDDLAGALPGETLSVGDVGDVLESGLTDLTLGLAPPTADQVLVGAIERSRQPPVRAAILLGFNEGAYPRELREDAVLNDDDRRVLRAAGARLAAPARDRVLDEALLAYIALTRASERLLITHAALGDDGAALRRSPYLDAVESACPSSTRRRVVDPAVSGESWDVQGVPDLACRLPLELRTRPAAALDDSRRRADWNAVYEFVRCGRDGLDPVASALRAMADQEDAPLDAATVQRLHSGRLKTSVSRLETFAACPFKHFSQDVLRLRERESSDLAALDMGLVHHAVLEDFIIDLSGDRGDFAALGEEELHERLRRSMRRVTERLPSEGELGRARNSYLLRRSASELARAVRAHQRVARSASFRPKSAEVSFGMGGEGGLPALTLETPGGRRALLRGFIDRVDLVEGVDEALGVVIDYKRMGQVRHLDLSQVYHGLSLQLVAYMLVLAEHGTTLAGRPIRPIGAFYLNLPPRYHAVEHPEDVTDRDRELNDAFRPRGLLDFTELDHFEALPNGGRATCFSAYRRADGEPGHLDATDAVPGKKFGAVLDGVRLRLGELCDRLLDGDVRVAPYRLGALSPCSWCPFGSVCRFEAGLSEARYLEGLRRRDVFDRFTEDLATRAAPL